MAHSLKIQTEKQCIGAAKANSPKIQGGIISMQHYYHDIPLLLPCGNDA